MHKQELGERLEQSSKEELVELLLKSLEVSSNLIETLEYVNSVKECFTLENVEDEVREVEEFLNQFAEGYSEG